jgi:tight adherence protein C
MNRLELPMPDPDLLLVLLAAAACATLAFAAVYRLVVESPKQDRRWHDRPPAMWRLLWPLVLVIAPRLEPWLPARPRGRLQQTLRRAGLDFSLDAGQFLAGRMMIALATAATAAFVAHLIGLAVWLAAVGWVIGWLLPGSWLRDRSIRRMRTIEKALPFYLDIVTLSVESGANLTGALALAVDRGPSGPLQDELNRLLRDVRAGRTRAEALRALAERIDTPAIGSWVSALIAADRHGSGLGAILRAQADQRRQERFQLAEKLAMQAPVKMLFPLLVFIFPCTFVLLFFPIVVRLIEEGILR